MGPYFVESILCNFGETVHYFFETRPFVETGLFFVGSVHCDFGETVLYFVETGPYFVESVPCDFGETVHYVFETRPFVETIPWQDLTNQEIFRDLGFELLPFSHSYNFVPEKRGILLKVNYNRGSFGT